MLHPLHVTSVTLTPSRPLDQAEGLLGWVAVELNGELVVTGITLRRTRQGDLDLSFPARTDRRGRKHPIVRVDDELRAAIEREVLGELRRQGRLAS